LRVVVEIGRLTESCHIIQAIGVLGGVERFLFGIAKSIVFIEDSKPDDGRSGIIPEKRKPAYLRISQILEMVYGYQFRSHYETDVGSANEDKGRIDKLSEFIHRLILNDLLRVFV